MRRPTALVLATLGAALGTACASATPAPTPAPAGRPAPASIGTPSTPDTPTGTTIVAAAWTGNKSRKLYYLAGCPATKLIPAADTISFRTAVEAKAAGFTRAIVPDC